MDWQVAIHYAKLVKAAEEIAPNEICGSSLTASLRGTSVRYTVLANVFANDLATDSNESRRELIVSMGYVAQDEAGNVVIAIRGTHGIHEWLHDCRYSSVPCPFLPDAGDTEDGFTEVYLSLRLSSEHGSPRLRDALAEMTFPIPMKSMTLCGHSLGAAVATLLALDLAANTQYKDLSLFTFASPRTGDDRFAEVFKPVRIEDISNREPNGPGNRGAPGFSRPLEPIPACRIDIDPCSGPQCRAPHRLYASLNDISLFDGRAGGIKQ